MQNSNKHHDLLVRLMPPLLIIVASVMYLFYKEKQNRQKLQIISTEVIIDNIKTHHSDSALKAGADKIKALHSESGLDSLVNQIK